MSKLSNTKITVLNQFEARVDEWTFGDFEQALKQAMGSEYGNYQTAKMAIVEADREGRWPETVRRYTSTISRSFGNVPQELVHIAKRIGV